jgi:tetratricopeptide (TPR) repeat protein
VSLLFILEKEERKALGALSVALFAKASAIFMPGVYWLFGVRGRKLWPFLILSVASGVTTLLANHWNFHEHEAPVFNLAWYERPLMMVQNLLFYVASFVWPHPLAYLYSYQTDWSAWKMGFEAILIVGVAAGIWRWRPSKITQLCLAGYGILIFPALGLVIIPNMKLSLVSDHWAYLPDVFLCLLVARGLERVPTRAVYALSGVGIGLFAFLSFQHAKTFATEMAFWEQARTLAPTSAIPYYNLGTVYDRLGDDVSAKTAYESAVKHDPDHSRAWYNLGRVHFRLGQPGYAREEFQRSIRLNPKLDLAYVALAKVNLSLQDTAEAERVLREGLEKNPDSLELKTVLEKVLKSADSL